MLNQEQNTHKRSRSPRINDIQQEKKRGRPLKISDKQDDISWNINMIEQLLSLKETYASLFLNAKDKKFIIQGWSRVTLDFNTCLILNLPTIKIKRKYQDLQRMYRKIQQAEDTTTGNIKTIKKPLYWDSLVSHFGGRQGMAHQCLNTNQVKMFQNDEINDTSSENSSVEEIKSNSISLSTPSNISRSSSKKKANIALTSMGTELKEGLIEMGKQISQALSIPSQNQSLSENSTQVYEILKDQVKQSSETNNLLQEYTKQTSETNQLLRDFI